jgi:protein-L-isoaspartate(D-aspartate) O-methyltransferase
VDDFGAKPDALQVFPSLLHRGRYGMTRFNNLDERVLTVADFSTRRTMMVDTQVRPSDVTKFPIIEAMLAVPRELFVPSDKREAAYASENIALGGGAVVLEPRTLAKLLDALDIQPGEVVLDLGCGLGYSTAVLARLADFVVSVEADEDRATEAQTILSEQGVDNAAVMAGPLADGSAKSGPYDVVIIQGAVEQLPQAIVDQVKEGGRIGCVFAEGALGVVRVGYKIDGRLNWRYAFNAGAPVLAGFEKSNAFAL